MNCPKCQYIRKKTDASPKWQCPNCGIAYNKHQPEYLDQIAKSKNEKEKKKRKNVALANLLPALFMFYLFVHGMFYESITLPTGRVASYTLNKIEHPGIFILLMSISLITSIGLTIGSIFLYIKASKDA